jgi:ATP adenylyltransferase
MQYIQQLGDERGCFICHNAGDPAADDKNLVLWRTRHCLVFLNRFPYNNGHLLVSPLRHISDFEEADEAEMIELIKLAREAQKALRLAIEPQGFNVGMNFGRCAGAGLPGHMHVHVVPRWEGDTNFMSVCGDTDVVSQSLDELFQQLKRVSSMCNLPDIAR